MRSQLLKTNTFAEISERLVEFSSITVLLEDRFEDRDDLIPMHIVLKFAGQSRADRTATEIHRVLIQASSNQANLGAVRAGATVRTTGHAHVRHGGILETEF